MIRVVFTIVRIIENPLRLRLTPNPPLPKGEARRLTDRITRSARPEERRTMPAKENPRVLRVDFLIV